ncbi:hypothetical protein WT29_23335 [Burkholderia stagnalis]|uniref:Uncharacterized protein n=1 Tax=Burkholderia stagnalis TaxID=1503054 RepID=A0A6L3MW47_9BURK|nr:hypothetical protein [Burkholderia stagnalis]KAB0637263.1 hypothetical protein F7R25_15985 [Burkholderia stagnalis]KVW61784.1 hypothetical protein WT28_15775 [Burkholderia stagnalis]KVW75024.1 hypothetical protein WT29_23335 [Burkholderia stagnalis]KVX78580.1 hypothetical protein WT34_10565 [Burkholderia stagnalis]KWN53946.1 hypothetical protein WT89_23630 [Burkholderia stagnalis]
MQKYDFTAPASGASQVVNVPGRYLKYVSGTAGGNDTGLIVTPGGKPGSKILLYPGQAVTLPNDGTAGPNAWTIANATGQAQISGTIVIGDGRIDDNTLQGTVQVVDGGKSRTLSAAAKVGTSFQGAVSAQYSRVQLWNPANSGIRLVIEAVTENQGNATQYIGCVFNTVQLANLTQMGQPKLAGGAVSVAGTYYDSTASSLPATTFLQMSLQANTTFSYPFKEPLILPPGYGLVVWGNVVNTPIGANFEWYEEPNV